MAIIYRLFLALSLVLFLGCSNDDLEMAPAQSSLEFTAIGENENSIYQYDFLSFSEEGALINLSEEMNIGPSYITLREVGDVLTFYTFDSENFSAGQRNVRTGFGSNFENFYTENVQRSITWGANSENKFFLGFYEPKGSKNLSVKILDLEKNSDLDIFVENDVLNAYQPLYYNDKLFVTYRDSVEQYHISIIDTNNNSILTKLEYGEFSPSILVDGSGDLIVIENKGNNTQTSHRYDMESLESIEENTFQISRSFLPGYLNTEFINNRFYYQNLYTQPSSLVFGPAFYDFESSLETKIDLEGIVADFQEEFEKSVRPISQGYDAVSGSFLVGYGNIDDLSELTGGVLVISEKGVLLGHVELPFVPTYFVKSTI